MRSLSHEPWLCTPLFITTISQCLQIRFTRRGRKQLPFYRVIAIDHREKRDGRPLEARAAAAKPTAPYRIVAGSSLQLARSTTRLMLH